MTANPLRWQSLMQFSAVAASIVIAISMTSCGEAPMNGKEVLTSISCKNESPTELWGARVVVGDRSFGFGYINLQKKATMVVGDLTQPNKVVVHYSFYPADKNPKSVVEKIVEFPGEKLVGFAAQAGEVEVVCKGDEKWTIRVYERAADHKGKVLFEADMTVPENKP
jgi:hypothetical protein